MRTIWIIFISLGFVSGVCRAQLSITAGYGTFAMADLKGLQEKQAHQFPVKAEITSSFPPYWIYGISGKKSIGNKLMLGVVASAGSTGSRVYYEDYSGSVGSDQVLRFKAVGLHFGILDELKPRKLYFTVDANPGVVFTSMKFRDFQSLRDLGQSEVVTELRSINLSVQPTFALTRRFDWFGINVFLGYHAVVVFGKLKLKENKDAYLVDDRGTPVKADWSGLRVGVGAVLFLKRASASVD